MSRVHTLSVLAVSLACVLDGVVDAQAQSVQRIVGPDGRVTYTDRAAPATAPTTAPVTEGKPSAAPSTNPSPPSATLSVGGLPFVLRQSVQRYPVTLYTGDKCGTCVSARELLVKRGVPFTEKTVTTQEDAQVFAGLGAENVLPLTTVGAQRMSGFVAGDLNRYLDAAGYPATSLLPRNFRYPAAQALAPVAPATPPTAPSIERAATALPTSPPPSVVAPPSSNPAGIRF